MAGVACRALLALLLALVSLGAGGAAGAAQAPLRVMALGDSVTVGAGSSHGGGYRPSFCFRMRDAGVEVDMVGGKADGPDTFDNRHQGYPHAPLYDLSAGVPEKVRTYQPDVVLLLAGSDEANTDSFSPHAFEANLQVMIDRLFTAKRDAKLLIATVPPPRYGRKSGPKRALNELVRRAVRERADRGEAVYLVDTFKLLDPQRDRVDANHPNDSGYERIGEAFANALLSVLGTEPIE
jgi:lysophospholipase L1-like esterase